MKTLLIPTLALAFSCLPTLAEDATTSKNSPPSTGASKVLKNAAPESPTLQGSVHFDGASLKDVVEALNNLLKHQGADELNIVISPELDKVTVPAITLRNVSATDVLNVITKVAGLSLEPVPSDSGKAAAWIIGRRKPASSKAGTNFGLSGGVGAGAGAGVGATDPTEGSDASSPAAGTTTGAQPGGAEAQIGDAPGGGAGFLARIPVAGRLFMGAGTVGSGGGSGNVTWEDPAAGGAAPAQINRVLGIARIYADIADETERAEKEAMLVKTMREITEQQKLHCEVRLYPALHVIVVKGNPEAVELVEQTISALKENLWGKKSDWSGSKSSSGIRP
jgi:hypothetical protein